MSKPTPYDGLLHEVCVGMGYCGSSVHVDELLEEMDGVTPDQWAELVLQAEHDGRKSDTYIYHEHFGQIRAAFVRHFGDRIVPVASLFAGHA